METRNETPQTLATYICILFTAFVCFRFLGTGFLCITSFFVSWAGLGLRDPPASAPTAQGT